VNELASKLYLLSPIELNKCQMPYITDENGVEYLDIQNIAAKFWMDDKLCKLVSISYKGLEDFRISYEDSDNLDSEHYHRVILIFEKGRSIEKATCYAGSFAEAYAKALICINQMNDNPVVGV